MAFNSPRMGKHPSIPRDQDLILQHPLNMRLIRRYQLILHRLSTPIILHRVVHSHYLQQSCLHPHRMKVLLAKVTLLQVLPQRRKFVKKRWKNERSDFTACFPYVVVINIDIYISYDVVIVSSYIGLSGERLLEKMSMQQSRKVKWDMINTRSLTL